MNEAELLLSEILNCDRLSLYLNRDLHLDKDKSAIVWSTLKRRMQGEPIQYILGKTEFMGLRLKVNKDVFIPRPETEVLVETTIRIVRRFAGSPVRKLKILDIGTGSGCIAISLAKLLSDDNVTIIAIDISQEAVNIARYNALLNNVADKVRFIHGNLFTPLHPQSPAYESAVTSSYDLIVSNPPYIPTAEIKDLQPEIRYEPHIALAGGRDGLDYYRRIISQSLRYLKYNGFLIMEMGFNQAKTVENIFQKSGKFEIIEVVKDYNNIERVIVAKLK